MICQRCGYCCVTYDVVVPVVVDGKVRAQLKPHGVQCPHLSFDGPRAFCAMHSHAAFNRSPCWSHNNSEVDPDAEPWKGRPCRLGVYCLKAKTTFSEPKAGELQDLAPWPEPEPF